jgi:hypothetical protein
MVGGVKRFPAVMKGAAAGNSRLIIFKSTSGRNEHLNHHAALLAVTNLTALTNRIKKAALTGGLLKLMKRLVIS